MPEFDFSAQEMEKLGYDKGVVGYFRQNYPDVLSSIWGSASDYYQGILTNTISRAMLLNATGHFVSHDRSSAADLDTDQAKGNYYYAAKALLEYREIIHPH